MATDNEIQQVRACPACEQGKHAKCSGWARRRRYIICPCNTRYHQPDERRNGH